MHPSNKQLDEKQTGTESLSIEIEASDLVINRLKRLLAMMARNSVIGHSANFGMFVDGDGADFLKVVSPDLSEFNEEIDAFQAPGRSVAEMAGEDNFYGLRGQSNKLASKLKNAVKAVFDRNDKEEDTEKEGKETGKVSWGPFESD